MRKPLTAPDRLDLLLDWLNGEPLSVAAVRRQLDSFLESFDGSVSAGHLRVHAGTAGQGIYEIEDVSSETLDAMRERLIDLLRRGFPPNIVVKHGKFVTDQQWGESFPNIQPFPSLRFGVLRLPRPVLKLSRASSDERRTYRAPGAYTLLVEGELADLVPFLVAHLLTASGMAVVARCPAPAPSNWDERCRHFLVRTTGGHPREFCSEACRVRSYAERVRKEQEATRTRRKIRTRKRRA